MELTQKEILKELEKVSERMARGWESQWTLKEIYQMILDMNQTEFEALCPSCNKYFIYPVKAMTENLFTIYKYQGFIVTVCDDCQPVHY